MQDQELTGWFDLSEQKPWEPGVYEVNSFLGGDVYSYWDGEKFKYIAMSKEKAFLGRHSQTFRIESEIKWRGLSSDPNAKPKPKRSGNPKVTRYVVMHKNRFGEFKGALAVFESADLAREYANMARIPVRIQKIRFRSPE